MIGPENYGPTHARTFPNTDPKELRDLGRQAGIASVFYAEYAIERLEMCGGVCTHLVGVLD